MKPIITVSVDLTAPEIQTLTAAMAGNFPDSLAEHRVAVLRKLARAHGDYIDALDESHEKTRRNMVAHGLDGGRLSPIQKSGGISPAGPSPQHPTSPPEAPSDAASSARPGMRRFKIYGVVVNEDIDYKGYYVIIEIEAPR
jgi:hypothetical protein